MDQVRRGGGPTGRAPGAGARARGRGGTRAGGRGAATTTGLAMVAKSGARRRENSGQGAWTMHASAPRRASRAVFAISTPWNARAKFAPALGAYPTTGG